MSFTVPFAIMEIFASVSVPSLQRPARYGNRRGEWNSIEIIGDQTLWILAPDSEIGEAVRAALAFPAEHTD